jgi:lysophospholipase L1-like esterase
MRNSRIANLLLSVAALSFFLVGLEGLCRLLGLGERDPVAFYIANWERQWQGDFYVLTAGGNINRDGLRDRDHAVENPGGAHRIAFLGDSVTFGWNLPAASSYPAMTERLLAEQGEEVEVFNIALPGWSTRQQRIAYRRIARKYRPDQVLLALCLNDVAEMLNNLSRPPRAFAFAYRHSNLVRALLRAREREIGRVEELFLFPDSERVRRGWELTLEEIRALAAEVGEDGASFTLLVFPFRFQVEEGGASPLPQQLVARFSQESGIHHLDLLPELRSLGRVAFIDYDHLSPQGAQRVARTLVASGLLARPSPGDSNQQP